MPHQITQDSEREQKDITLSKNNIAIHLQDNLKKYLSQITLDPKLNISNLEVQNCIILSSIKFI